MTNEGGVYGTVRLLKNVMGLWILQQCRATWAEEGRLFSYSDLTALAKQAHKRDIALINPNDPIFLAPGNHPQHIRQLCQQSGHSVPETVGEIVCVVLQSLAMAYRDVLRELTAVSNRTVAVIHIVGGGTQNKLLNQMTANATGLPVMAGPIEATVIGNALVQLITLGEIKDIQEARQIVAEMGMMERYDPLG